jgi:sphingomyelin phosphodiesterase
VYILGHIPPTISGTAEEYATVYRALIAKYSDKIKGQFFGHTHSDQLTVNTYPNTDKATGYGFICPSMSPLYVGAARSRVYKLAIGDENGVNDYTQYIFKDLSSKTANWSKEYKFREKYNLAKT